eukprot:gnl/MRDRNA2_/MRDRNA2_85161_c0_seq10.p1 gnl/MRDRNA2_/MRDRNA2_85161_c0~~gnl/MRDRNA2_/MRDRNA2_85161_c0_seq10.p1  ORF type:complete len:712 (+),score=148.76 gnl/MRDRNA2_/MRDRNA2_85161_c0_seq10:170-2137(+)
MDALSWEVMKKMKDMIFQDISNTLWAFAKLGFANTELFEAMSWEIIKKIGDFEPQNLAITAWAYATIGFVKENMMEAIAGESRKRINAFTPQCCANLSFAFAKLGIRNDDLMKCISEQVLKTINKFRTQELCNVAWGSAKVQMEDEALMEAIAKEVVVKVSHMNPQDLSKTSWSFATARIKNDKMMDEISWEVMAKVGSFGNQDLSNTCWSFAKLGIANAMMMAALGKELVVQVKNLIPQDLSNTAWAFATLGLPDNDLMDELLMEVIAKIEGFVPQNVANTSWAFAKLGLWNERLMEVLSLECLRKLKDFDCQGLANVSWAFAVLGFKCERMTNGIMQETLERISRKEFDTQELANIAWAWDVTGDHTRLKQFLEIAIPAFQDESIANYKDGASWGDFANITARHGGQFTGADTLYNEFKERFYTPVLKSLQQLRDPNQGGSHQEAWEDLQQTVNTTSVSGFGYYYSRDAYQALGIQTAPRGQIQDWMIEYRQLALEHLEEWRIPGTENIICVTSYCFLHGGVKLESEPKVVLSGWADGVHDEVKAMLKPIHAHITRENHSERVAFLEMAEAARETLGEDCLRQMTGWVRFYGTHQACISCLAIVIQFMRHAPNVTMEVDYDNAWYNCCGEPRPIHTLPDPSNEDMLRSTSAML